MALLITPSPSGSERLVTQLRTTSFFDDPQDYRKKIGMAAYLVRLARGPGTRTACQRN